MTLVVRDDPNVSIDVATAQFSHQISGLLAGEDIDSGAPCYLNSSDGKLYMSNGTAVNEAAEIVGFAPRNANIGEPLTVFGAGTRMHYAASGLTPGDVYYIAATTGRLDDTVTTGDAVGVAQAITATDIRITRDI